MKILHVLIAPRAEGTPRLVLDWLGVTAYQQDLLFLSPDGELRNDFEATGVWQHYNTAFEPRLKRALKIADLVKDICIARKPDVVISWSLGFSHWVAWGARKAGIMRNLAHAGNPPSDTLVGRYVHTWISLGMGRLFGNKIIACSKYVRDAFISIPGISSKHVFAVYNCARVERFFPTEQNARRSPDFVMVATLEVHKDHKTLLHAWKILSPRLPESKLWIAGDGSLRDALQMLAADLGLINVAFMGTVNNVPQLLQRCDTFVFSTTHNEGFGTVLIEALAAGCKVIATDVAACREVLEGGKYGKLVAAQDPDALAIAMDESIRHKLSDDERAVQQAYAARFAPEEMIRGYLIVAGLIPASQ